MIRVTRPHASRLIRSDPLKWSGNCGGKLISYGATRRANLTCTWVTAGWCPGHANNNNTLHTYIETVELWRKANLLRSNALGKWDMYFLGRGWLVSRPRIRQQHFTYIETVDFISKCKMTNIKYAYRPNHLASIESIHEHGNMMQLRRWHIQFMVRRRRQIQILGKLIKLVCIPSSQPVPRIGLPPPKQQITTMGN
jgi:hypothetical protein